VWPWEHVAVGYLLYSLSLRLLGRRPPTDSAAAVLVAATLLPDVLDKTLSWGLDVFPTGYAIGHSALLAVPAGVLAILIADRGRHRRWADAFVLGHWSHLLTDVLNPLRYGRPVEPARILWPIAEQVPYETDYGLRRGLVYLEALATELAAMDPLSVFLLYVLVPLVTVGVWLWDGAPGVAGVVRSAGRLRDLLRGPRHPDRDR
jgi:hypothetical protein